LTNVSSTTAVAVSTNNNSSQLTQTINLPIASNISNTNHNNPQQQQSGKNNYISTESYDILDSSFSTDCENKLEDAHKKSQQQQQPSQQSQTTTNPLLALTLQTSGEMLPRIAEEKDSPTNSSGDNICAIIAEKQIDDNNDNKNDVIIQEDKSIITTKSINKKQNQISDKETNLNKSSIQTVQNKKLNDTPNEKL